MANALVDEVRNLELLCAEILEAVSRFYECSTRARLTYASSAKRLRVISGVL